MRRLQLALLLLASLPFLPALTQPFLWDDAIFYTDNPAFRGPGGPSLRWMLTDFHLGPYQPLHWLLAASIHRVWGLEPAGYHLAGLLLHSLNSWLLFLLIRRLLAAALGGAPGDARLGEPAFLAALFFALHPLRVESVAWAAELRGLQAAFWLLFSILAYLKAAGAAPSARGAWRAASVAAFAASLLAKASGLGLPFVLLALDAWPLRRLGRGAARARVLLEKAPYLLLALTAGAFQVWTYARSVGLVDLSRFGAAQRVAQACYGWCFYILKTALPWGLSPLYQRPTVLDLGEGRFLAAAASAGALAVLAWKMRRRWPAAGAVWVGYTAGLLPVLGFFQHGIHLAADRFSYLPGMALSAGLAGLLARLGPRPLWGALALAALSWEAGLARRQTLFWRDSEVLWRRALTLDPSSTAALNNLGNELMRRGMPEEAAARLRDAMRIGPDYANPAYNLGNLRAAQGRSREAAGLYGEALRRDPGHVPARVNLATVLLSMGRTREAVKELEEALRLDPRRASAHANLGAALARQGRFQEAVLHLREAILLDPDLETARRNLTEASLRAK